MAEQRFPGDANRPARDEDFERAARLDAELQPDPELAEGPASNGRIALFAIAIAFVLGVVFYGLNNSRVEHASTAPPAHTAQTQPAPSSSPATGNNQPGMTTGSATHPNAPQAAPPPSGANKP